MFDTNFENPTLCAVAQAFNARKKALKHKAGSFSLSRRMETGSSESAEEMLLIELALGPGPNMPRLGFDVKVWADRWVSGVAYQRGHAAENWTSEFGGRMASSVTPTKFERDIENFWDGISFGRYRSTSDAAVYWQHKLIRGPIGLGRELINRIPKAAEF